MRKILYLSFDSLREGVGASQVLAYMRKVQPFFDVTIISFEKKMPTRNEKLELEEVCLKWVPLPFGRFGAIGGIGRVFRMWKLIDRSKIIHARSTLPGLAALLRFPRIWIWDCRSLQADHRRALSDNREGNPVFIIMRLIEFILARRSTAIIVITKTVVPIFISRYSISPSKVHVISTCVDTRKFQLYPFEHSDEIKILFAGTFSPAYDISLTNKIVLKLREYRRVKITVATSLGSTDLWKALNYDEVISVPHDQMPKLIQRHDLGISLWKNNLGICLTSVASTKTAEFLATGRPVIINSLQGDFGVLIRRHSAGVVTDGDSESDIQNYANQILRLMDDATTSNRCRKLAVETFSLDDGVSKLMEIYRTIQQ